MGGANPSLVNYGGGRSPPSAPYIPPSFEGYGNDQATAQAYGSAGCGMDAFDHGEQALPHGWEKRVLPGGRTMFVDHNTQVG